jgi:hypothetical protein
MNLKWYGRKRPCPDLRDGTWKVLKCGAAGGWKRSVGLIM